MSKPENYLGLDWGERKIGLALAHAETQTAVAYGIFPNDSQLIEVLRKVVAEELIGTIIVGIPRYDQLSKETHPAKQFGEQLKKILAIEVVYTDEMFTSKLAQETLKLLGGKHVGAGDDAEAARILLQSWLEK